MTDERNSTAYEEWEGQKACLTRQPDGTYIGWPCRNCGCTERNRQKKCPNCRRLTVENSKELEALKRKAKFAAMTEEQKKAKNKSHYKKYKPFYDAKSKLHKSVRKRAKCNFKSKEIIAAILEIYKNVPQGCHVDHIVPIAGGDKVCGLHVPWNLQYLPAIKNMKKHNKWPTCQKSMQPACFDIPENGV